jgi:large subunit ribosomal protein L17
MNRRKFGRTPEHRKAMMRNLCTALVMHERITTTLQKAKEMRPFVERLIHKAKANTPQSRIYMKSFLFSNAAIDKLFNEIAPRFNELPAGFTRVELLGKRKSDKGDAAIIEILGN